MGGGRGDALTSLRSYDHQSDVFAAEALHTKLRQERILGLPHTFHASWCRPLVFDDAVLRSLPVRLCPAFSRCDGQLSVS